MSSPVSVPGFLPSTHGFHFGNSWPDEPVLTIPFPTGPISIGNAAGGLCGGMAFAVRDFFEDALPIPATTTNPAVHTPLYDYLIRRMFDSFDIPAGVATFYAWQLPTRDQGRDMVTGQWPVIRAELDAGRLVCLGLIRAKSFWPGELGKNHQVLAYGYNLDGDGRATLQLCDPNHHDRDDVTMAFPLDAGAPIEVDYLVGGEAVTAGSHERTYGAFVQRYAHCSPSAALDAHLPPVALHPSLHLSDLLESIATRLRGKD
ncbi:MAG: hypothetical protein ACRDVG_06055 [Jatrophihabitantaceae bacterium]